MKYLSPFVVVALAALPSHAGLIAHYELNEASGNALDSSASSFTGTAANAGSGRIYSQASVPAGTYGATTVTPAQAAAFGTSIDFGADAANFGNYNLTGAGLTTVDGLLEPGTGGNRIDGTLTVMAWVNLDTAAGVQSIFSSVQGGGGDGWRFGTNGTGLRFTTLGAQDFNQGSDLVAGTWYHLAVTVNNDAIDFYQNGNLIGSQTATVNYIEEAAGFEVKLGGKSTAAENMFGRLDDVKLYDNVLSASEIISAAAFVPEPSALVLVGLGTFCLLLRPRKLGTTHLS